MNLGKGKYMVMDKKDVKMDKDSTLKRIEDFSKDDVNEFNFPTKHL